MKNLKKLLPFVVIGLILTGCGSQNSQSQSNDSSASQSSTSSTSDQSTSSSNSATSQSSSSSTSTSQSSNANTTTSSKNSSAKTTSHAVAKKVNQGESGVATQNYSSANQAAQQINYQSNMGGESVDLGYGVKGTQDAGAGQVYVHFNMGNWSIAIHGNNVSTNGNNQVVPTAKNVVKYLQNHTLPYPNKRGAILLQADNGQGTSTIKWQDNTKVNTISASNASAALEKATSLPK